jgi:hypothetical protein
MRRGRVGLELFTGSYERKPAAAAEQIRQPICPPASESGMNLRLSR